MKSGKVAAPHMVDLRAGWSRVINGGHPSTPHRRSHPQPRRSSRRCAACHPLAALTTTPALPLGSVPTRIPPTARCSRRPARARRSVMRDPPHAACGWPVRLDCLLNCERYRPSVSPSSSSRVTDPPTIPNPSLSLCLSCGCAR